MRHLRVLAAGRVARCRPGWYFVWSPAGQVWRSYNQRVGRLFLFPTPTMRYIQYLGSRVNEVYLRCGICRNFSGGILQSSEKFEKPQMVKEKGSTGLLAGRIGAVGPRSCGHRIYRTAAARIKTLNALSVSPSVCAQQLRPETLQYVLLLAAELPPVGGWWVDPNDWTGGPQAGPLPATATRVLVPGGRREAGQPRLEV